MFEILWEGFLDPHNFRNADYKSPARIPPAQRTADDAPYDPLREWAKKVEMALFEAGYPNARVWWHYQEGWDHPSHARWGSPVIGVDPAMNGDATSIVAEKRVPDEVFQKACALAGPVPRL